MQPVLIIGAGLAGITIARSLADAGHPSIVIEQRPHLGGLCYSSRDAATGIEVHRYGPHIFHSSKAQVIQFIQRFDCWQPWVNRVKAVSAKGVFSLPINLHTINQFFGENFTPAEAKKFIASKQVKSIAQPANAEEQLLRHLGEELYENFFLHYSRKQWGVSPRELSANIVTRLPIRFNYEDSYFKDSFVALPRSGYSAWLSKILDHPLIDLRLNSKAQVKDKQHSPHCFYTGPLDAYYNYSYGKLSYRSLQFKYQRGHGDLQGCACLNNTSPQAAHTRSHEHKYFSPWEQHENSLLVHEYSLEAQQEQEAYYPKRLAPDLDKLQHYSQRAQREQNTSFVGRLASYQYLDMDQVIEHALKAAHAYLRTASYVPAANAAHQAN